jgi:hypothetical protein
MGSVPDISRLQAPLTWRTTAQVEEVSMSNENGAGFGAGFFAGAALGVGVFSVDNELRVAGSGASS